VSARCPGRRRQPNGAGVPGGLSPAGIALYADGALVASNPAVTAAQNYTGYWRIGYDNLTGWPGATANRYFTGSLAWPGHGARRCFQHVGR